MRSALVDPRGTKITLQCKEYSPEGVPPPSSPVSGSAVGVSTPNALEVRDVDDLSAIRLLIAIQYIKSIFHPR